MAFIWCRCCRRNCLPTLLYEFTTALSNRRLRAVIPGRARGRRAEAAPFEADAPDGFWLLKDFETVGRG